MSVHAGLWSVDGTPVRPDVLFNISELSEQYGPDGAVIRDAGAVVMLYRAFHTTPESRLEIQPHVFGNDCAVTWDGRLDNRADLLRELEKSKDPNDGDVTVVADAFEKWGEGCLSKLRGDWSLSIWRPQEKELILARDYAGVRQMFFCVLPNAVIWCNHLAPLVRCGERFHLCDSYLAGHLALWPDADLTPYQEIRSVLPGSFVKIRNGAAQVYKHWSFARRRKHYCSSDQEYEQHFRHLFRKAVARRLRSDSPILADLSGGLDSSSIVCMADDILNNGEAQVPSLDTFSTHDREESGDEDYLYFTKVEQKRGRRGHHAELCGIGDELCFGDSSFTATPAFIREDIRMAKSSLVRRGNYRVVLSGLGGDEMLGQALDPRIQLADLIRQGRIANLAKQLWTWSLLLRRPWMHLLWDAVLLQFPPWIRSHLSSAARVDPWVTHKFAREQKLAVRQLDAAEGAWFWAPSERDAFQTILMLTRQMSQMQPTFEEIRYPYLDQDLCEFLMSIPAEQLLRPGERRSLMRRALRDLLPPEIVNRRTKSSGSRYFSVGLEKHWDELEPLIKMPLIAELGYVNREQFVNALTDAKNGKLSLYFLRLMKALFWELWLRKAIADDLIIAPSIKKPDSESI